MDVKNSLSSIILRKSYLISYSLMLGGFTMVMFSAFILNVLLFVYIGLIIGAIGSIHYIYVFRSKLYEKPPKTKQPWES